MLSKTQNQFCEFCAEKNWTGIHNITRDFSGEIDCRAIEKWAKDCSNSLFSVKPNCYCFYVQDYKVKN